MFRYFQIKARRICFVRRVKMFFKEIFRNPSLEQFNRSTISHCDLGNLQHYNLIRHFKIFKTFKTTRSCFLNLHTIFLCPRRDTHAYTSIAKQSKTNRILYPWDTTKRYSSIREISRTFHQQNIFLELPCLMWENVYFPKSLEFCAANIFVQKISRLYETFISTDDKKKKKTVSREISMHVSKKLRGRL